VHRRLRYRLAAPSGDRQADRRRRSECFDRRDERPLGRKAAGHLHGHPISLFSGDQKPGDTNGQGVNAFGGLWYALSSAGNQIVGSAPNPGLGY
jgi:hypothetical protein